MGKMKEMLIEEEGYSVLDTLKKRGERYGEYSDVSYRAQAIKDILRGGRAWDMMESYQQESLDMIANKLSRIVNGDPFYKDNWHDISGYANLVEIELDKL